jgi:S-adenosylmethionine-diacylglycerol 3-amino-3-carboxypropyl transferase
VEQDDGVPPYLSESGVRAVSQRADRLALVDGSVLACLRTLPSGSVHCFALSNVCEWLTVEQVAEQFCEIERVAAPGARLVFRNYVGWTDLPRECTRFVKDSALGDALIKRDRSAVQARVVVCRAAA